MKKVLLVTLASVLSWGAFANTADVGEVDAVTAKPAEVVEKEAGFLAKAKAKVNTLWTDIVHAFEEEQAKLEAAETAPVASEVEEGTIITVPAVDVTEPVSVPDDDLKDKEAPPANPQ